MWLKPICSSRVSAHIRALTPPVEPDRACTSALTRYPAAHIYLYAALAKIAPSTDTLLPAQLVFGAVYLATLLLVAQLYRLAGVCFFC